MNTAYPRPRFSPRRRVDPRFAWAQIAAILCCGGMVRAEEAATNRPLAGPVTGARTAPVPGSPAAPSSQGDTSRQSSAEVLSPLVQAVVKMSGAGVSTTVIKTYVECSPSADPPTDLEIIALKRHNVPDEIVTTLLGRSAKLRALEAQRKNELVARALAARNATSGGLDPESYEFFKYYYLQPRTLSSVYQRLSPYYGPRGTYRYGPGRVLGFHHHGYDRFRY